MVVKCCKTYFVCFVRVCFHLFYLLINCAFLLVKILFHKSSLPNTTQDHPVVQLISAWSLVSSLIGSLARTSAESNVERHRLVGSETPKESVGSPAFYMLNRVYMCLRFLQCFTVLDHFGSNSISEKSHYGKKTKKNITPTAETMVWPVTGCHTLGPGNGTWEARGCKGLSMGAFRPSNWAPWAAHCAWGVPGGCCSWCNLLIRCWIWIYMNLLIWT